MPLPEGRNANDAPGAIADAKDQIDGALFSVADVSNDALDASAALPLAIELPEGMIFDMTGEQYTRDLASPALFPCHRRLSDPS